MLDPAGPAAEVIEQHLPHGAPTQVGASAQRSVHVRDADDPFGDEVINFAPNCRLQSAGDMPWQFQTG